MAYRTISKQDIDYIVKAHISDRNNGYRYNIEDYTSSGRLDKAKEVFKNLNDDLNSYDRGIEFFQSYMTYIEACRKYIEPDSLQVTISRIVDNLSKEKVTRLDSTQIRFILENVKIDSFDYSVSFGNFEIRLYYQYELMEDENGDEVETKEWRVRVIPVGDNNVATNINGREVVHPHVNYSTGFLCQGSYKDLIVEAMENFDYDSAINFVKQIMSNYNEDDAENSIVTWVGQKCAECFDYTKDFKICRISGQTICNDCAILDPITNDYSLTSLRKECNSCGKITASVHKSKNDSKPYCTLCIEKEKEEEK